MSEQITPAHEVEEWRRNEIRKHFCKLVSDGLAKKEYFVTLPCKATWFLEELSDAGYEVHGNTVKLPGEPVVESQRLTIPELTFILVFLLFILSSIF